jgi:hypothetical protein
VVPQVAAGEAGGPEGERAARGQEGLDAGVGEPHSRHAGAGRADYRAGECFHGGGVVAGRFGVQEAPVGGVACLRHGGEVSQLLADAEVAGLVDRRFCPDCPAFFEVLLDLGLVVEQVDVRAGAAGDDLGPERAGGS